MNPRRLHIGGEVRADGWEVLNAKAGPCVDHVGDAADLSRFEAGTFAAVYASHVLEHFDYTGALDAALREWHRVLAPGGELYVSVPDLQILALLFLQKAELTLSERFDVMKMIFGGHVDRYDIHLVGFDADILTTFLKQAGFVNLRRMQSFDIFQDTSSMTFKGVPISLNIVAEVKLEPPAGAIPGDCTGRHPQ